MFLSHFRTSLVLHGFLHILFLRLTPLKAQETHEICKFESHLLFLIPFGYSLLEMQREGRCCNFVTYIYYQ